MNFDKKGLEQGFSILSSHFCNKASDKKQLKGKLV